MIEKYNSLIMLTRNPILSIPTLRINQGWSYTKVVLFCCHVSDLGWFKDIKL